MDGQDGASCSCCITPQGNKIVKQKECRSQYADIVEALPLGYRTSIALINLLASSQESYWSSNIKALQSAAKVALFESLQCFSDRILIVIGVLQAY